MSIDWETFLTKWISLERLRRFSEDITYDDNNPYLGFAGASEKKIHEAEDRLGIAFPPSYKRFISFTNGWYKNSIHGYAYHHLLPIEEVDWFRDKETEWIQIYAETLEYSYEDIPILTKKISPYDMDFEDDFLFLQCLKSALQVSKSADCDVILLIPNIEFNNGEWEAWYFADWAAGIDKYPSFEELMIKSFDISKWIWEKNSKKKN